MGTHTHCTGNCYSLIGRAGAANPNPLTWELGDGEPLAEHVAEVVAVPGEEVVGVSRPLAAELPQDPVHGGDGALGLPEDDALAVGVHGVLPDGAAEDAAAVLAEPERPLLLAIDLRTSEIRTKKGEREPTKISEIWRRKEGEGEAKANAPLTRGIWEAARRRTWTALWKMPPRPIRSLKMRLIWRMVLFVFSESLFVTSYTWSTTSFISSTAQRAPSPLPAAPSLLLLLRRRRRGVIGSPVAVGERAGGGWLVACRWWWW